MRLRANHISFILCSAIAIFSVSITAVAVEKAKLTADLNDVHKKFDYFESQHSNDNYKIANRLQQRFERSLNKPKQYNENDSINFVGDDNEEQINYRLPTAIIPINYDLYLHPNIETGTFMGNVDISLNIKEPTKQIILHAHKLSIELIQCSENDSLLPIVEYHLDTIREFLIIDMLEEIQTGAEVVLTIIFKGDMLDKIVGLYSSTYLTPNNERRTIATSKFEPTYARQAFPCFDEPSLKATFEVTIVRPRGDSYHALSNMNEQNSVDVEDYTEVRFAKSVAMSTYLACFIVSDFAFNTREVNTNGIGDNFNIRIFATAHQLNKVDFALNSAVLLTEFYIRYFQVPYPLPKLDMAAIPDFVSNAMEHWGLVTYRETALLFDPNYSSTWNKQRIAAVVAHELSHMWFGNLVTMMWWNDLWLNEGFARYMEYKGLNEIYPEWGMPEQFLIHALHGVLKYDATVASHPIIQTVENPDQITEIFDTISYEKGASVIRMLEDVVGPTIFAQAVTNYLTNFQYANAITDDFIGEVASLVESFDVRKMMRTWTEQMGFPIIYVNRTDAEGFTISQKRFFSNIESYDEVYNDSPFNYRWTIPLTYITDERNVGSFWFYYDVDLAGIAVPANMKWVKLNIHQLGYYRVNYDDDTWRNIINDLIAEPNNFDIADRAHLLDDVFAIADASQLSYEIALNITKYLEKEFDFVPWYVAATKLQNLQNTLMYTDIYELYLQYARKLIEKVYNDVTWDIDADNHLQNRLRVTVLTAACSLGLPDCLAEASSRFTLWLDNAIENKPAPDLREIVYYYGLQANAKYETWEKMWDIFVAEQDASEKLKLMYGLSAIRVPWILNSFIQLAENEEYVRRQDYFTCIQNIAANPVGAPIVWEYVRENWPLMVERFGLNERYLGRMIPSITERFATEIKLEEMTEFFTKYPDAGAGTAARKQAIETVKYNIKWLEHNKDIVADWLNNNVN